MPFRFVLGRAGSGKTRFCLEALAAELRRSPDGPPLILLVPEQATFQMDRALVSLPGVRATVRAQVLSFRRLAWRVLAETGGAARPHIDESGKVMAIRALLSACRSELRVFGASADKPGFVVRLARTLSELRAYNVGPGELDRAYGSLEALGRGETALAAKLHDLALVSRGLEVYLAGRWVDPDDYLGLLASKLRDRPPSLAGARVWVDGFAGFTGQELDVLVALSAAAAAEVTVALCLDPRLAAERPPRPGPGAGPRNDPGPSTFYPVLRTYNQLLARLAEVGLAPAETITLEGMGSRSRFAGAPPLAHLERQYPEPVPEPYPADPAPRITLVAAATRQAEVTAAAREMVRLAREKGYRWREMGLVVRSLESYAPLIEATLDDFGVPFFIDRRRPAAYHPLVEFARSAVEAAARDWAPDPLFRLLKTDLWPLGRSEVDLLENYVLAHGLRGARTWTRDEPWHWRRMFSLDETEPPDPVSEETLRSIDGLRRRVAGLLGPYADKLAERESSDGRPATFRDKAAALWGLIEAAGVPQTLEQWCRNAVSEGRPEQAQIHEQVLRGLAGVLDQMALHLGERPCSLEDFGRVLEAGLQTLTLGLVPPTLDQVTVGAIDRSRQPDVRVCFVLGLNDGVFPAFAYEDQIFDDRERADLSESYGLELAPASRARALAEDYLAYIALTRPSERLWLSYTLSSDDGRAMAPSLVVGRLKTLFPALKETRVGARPNGPQELVAETEVLAEVTRVLAEARRAGRGEPEVDPGWLEAYNWLVADPDRRSRTAAALRSLGRGDRPAALAPEVAEALYGKPVRISISRLERYAGCPFSHFASAGLGLERRPRPEPSPPQIGSYYHAVLNLLSRELARDGLDLAELDDETLRARLRAAVEEVASHLETELLASRARYRYLTGRLERTVGWTVELLREHARRSRFRPVGTELRFDRFDLPAGEAGKRPLVRFRGFIDRLEAARPEPSGPGAAGGSGGTGGTGPAFVRVVDFKSGGRDYDPRLTESGLDLQLPAYLLVAVTQPDRLEGAAGRGPLEARRSGGPPRPAGAFFFPIADPFVRADGPLDDAELTRRRLSEVRVKGFFLDEPAVLDLMDRELSGAAGTRPLLPVTPTSSGALRRSPSLLSQERLELLLAFTRVKLMSLAGAIASGDIAVNPVRRPSGRTACEFCEYHPVCGFDPTAGDQLRRLPVYKKDEVWARMAAEVAARER